MKSKNYARSLRRLNELKTIQVHGFRKAVFTDCLGNFKSTH